MSIYTHEKTSPRFLAILAALVVSVAINSVTAYGFARATGAEGSAVNAYLPKGTVSVEFPEQA